MQRNLLLLNSSVKHTCISIAKAVTMPNSNKELFLCSFKLGCKRNY
jgi:hypothetical protein